MIALRRIRQVLQGKLIALGFLSAGVFLLIQVTAPILSFQIWEMRQKRSSEVLISPNSSSGSNVLGVSVQSKDNFPAFVSSLKRETQARYNEFNITIPKIKIETSVGVDSNDLTKGLAHLPGSALPGEKGNMFISGHSALSQFFSLKSALFVNLLDLKKGDQIFVEADGTKFRYEVTGIKTVDPHDLSVISPPDSSGRYVSLMTCVPPGLNFKRLVILGKMI